MQNFQLGSFDDVYTACICQRILRKKFADYGDCGVACLGDGSNALSGKILGIFQ